MPGKTDTSSRPEQGATHEWCQRFHMDGLGVKVNVGSALERIEYTRAQHDASVSERFLHSQGWRTVRVVNRPDEVRIHACRPVTAEPLTTEQANDFSRRWVWWRRHELECAPLDLVAQEKWLRDNGPAERVLPGSDRERLFAWVRERWSDIDPIARAGSDINTLALVVCEGLDLDLETARVLTRAAGCWS